MSARQTMLAATYTQGGEFSVLPIVRPTIADNEMLLRVRAASICGTDVKIIRNGHRKLTPGQQIVLGHEFVGTIDEVGERVEGYAPGQRVGVVPNAGCGHCRACTSGRANYCPSYTAFGIDRDGGHTTYVRIPSPFIAQGNIVRLPEQVSDEEASLLEPFSCVVNGVRAARLGLGDTVIIYGAGPMGLMHSLLCRNAGAAKVIMVDPQDSRLEQARRLGCDLTINPAKANVPECVQARDGRTRSRCHHYRVSHRRSAKRSRPDTGALRPALPVRRASPGPTGTTRHQRHPLQKSGCHRYHRRIGGGLPHCSKPGRRQTSRLDANRLQRIRSG